MKEGNSSAIYKKYAPITGKAGAKNLKNGILIKPTIIEAMAPFSLYFFQHKESRIMGQKVAAMPDHPNITNQNMVRVGE